MMRDSDSSDSYQSPKLIELGAAESITQQSNKEGNQTDQFSDTTPLVGSIEPA